MRQPTVGLVVCPVVIPSRGASRDLLPQKVALAFGAFLEEILRARCALGMTPIPTPTLPSMPIHIAGLSRLCLLLALPCATLAQARPERAQDMRIMLDGVPGSNDAITDVPGVLVGHTTLIRGNGLLEEGKGPVRTGVTAIVPAGRDSLRPLFAGWFSLNGNGEMTGTAWIEEYGYLLYPILITNTNSVGVARDAVIEWGQPLVGPNAWTCCLPVVAETWDGDLNDIFGYHVEKQHVFAAINSARGGPVQEGNVGGGTGMICLGFKGGIGTASRHLPDRQGGYTVGVLVQCNFGLRNQLRISGIPVARDMTVPPECYDTQGPLDSTLARYRCSRDIGLAGDGDPRSAIGDGPVGPGGREGSIIVIIATDAPLLPHQLKRIAKRASLGIGRMGGIAGSGSGDIFLAFSTARLPPADSTNLLTLRAVDDNRINPLYEATVQATEEAIINAMLAAETMTGANYYKVPALPHDQLRAVLAKYGRLRPDR